MDELFRTSCEKDGNSWQLRVGPPYNALHTQNAINGSALSKLKDLVGVLMQLETGLQIKFSDLKGSLERCCLQFPELRNKVDESKRCDYEGNMASALLYVTALSAAAPCPVLTAARRRLKKADMAMRATVMVWPSP